MHIKGYAITAGIGAAMGAVAVLMMPRNNPTRRLAAKAADKLLTVEGVQASFALVRIGDTVHISARSFDTVNVQIILEKLSGGGHFDSAAAQMRGTTLQSALLQLKSAIDSYFDGDAPAGGK